MVYYNYGNARNNKLSHSYEMSNYCSRLYNMRAISDQLSNYFCLTECKALCRCDSTSLSLRTGN